MTAEERADMDRDGSGRTRADIEAEGRAAVRERERQDGHAREAADSLDWRQTIADAAQPLLTEPGAVIVALLRDPPEPVSRFYPTADYGDSRRMRGFVWRRAARLQNEDTVGANYYVVVHYHNGTTIVYNGLDSILWEV
jgi:hypothetical protein